jgi:hypothetical protein
VYPGSATQAKIEGELEMVTAGIEAMVAAGELSTKVASAKLTWLREERVRNQEMAFAVEVRGLSLSEAYLEQTASTLDAMVERGELSAEDAEAKLSAVTEQVAAKEELARVISPFPEVLHALIGVRPLLAVAGNCRWLWPVQPGFPGIWILRLDRDDSVSYTSDN